MKPTEREIELRMIGRYYQSGYGPQSDVCEMVWEILSTHGIRADGKTPLTEYVRRLCVARDDTARMREQIQRFYDATQAKIMGKTINGYLHEQFPATVGHIPLHDWIARLGSECVNATEFLSDAARSVQPVAKAGDTITVEGDYSGSITSRTITTSAARQESAPTLEQQTETGGKWLHDDAYVYWADPARLGGLGENIGRAYDETDAKRFCAAYQLGISVALTAKDEQLEQATERYCKAVEDQADVIIERDALREQIRVMRDALTAARDYVDDAAFMGRDETEKKVLAKVDAALASASSPSATTR